MRAALRQPRRRLRGLLRGLDEIRTIVILTKPELDRGEKPRQNREPRLHTERSRVRLDRGILERAHHIDWRMHRENAEMFWLFDSSKLIV